jgi:hypothetical protein
MDIQSARALKQEIAAEVVPQAVVSIRAAGGFSITTFALEKMTKAEPLVALGIARGATPNDVRLAVRLQRHSLERSDQFLEDIRHRARDEVEVRYVGRVSKHATPPWYRSQVRPLRPGASVGHFKITAGTIGALATEKRSGQVVILSNNHVLANENVAETGDAIVQAGIYDGGKRPKDVVASLSKSINLSTTRPNLIDAAYAAVSEAIEVDPANYDAIGTLLGTRSAPIYPGLSVAKVGRTTGVTRGRISAIEVDQIVVGYDIGQLSFDDQIEIESTETGSFSAGGDSGSLIIDDEGRACGLLFAGSESGGSNGRGVTYANPIDVVLRRLAIQLVGT